MKMKSERFAYCNDEVLSLKNKKKFTSHDEEAKTREIKNKTIFEKNNTKNIEIIPHLNHRILGKQVPHDTEDKSEMNAYAHHVELLQ